MAPKVVLQFSPPQEVPLQREQVLVFTTLAAICFFKQHLTLLVSHLGLCQEQRVPSTFIGGKLENREWRLVWGPRWCQVQAPGAPVDVEERVPLSRLGLGRQPNSW